MQSLPKIDVCWRELTREDECPGDTNLTHRCLRTNQNQIICSHYGPKVSSFWKVDQLVHPINKWQYNGIVVLYVFYFTHFFSIHLMYINIKHFVNYQYFIKGRLSGKIKLRLLTHCWFWQICHWYLTLTKWLSISVMLKTHIIAYNGENLTCYPFSIIVEESDEFVLCVDVVFHEILIWPH